MTSKQTKDTTEHQAQGEERSAAAWMLSMPDLVEKIEAEHRDRLEFLMGPASIMALLSMFYHGPPGPPATEQGDQVQPPAGDHQVREETRIQFSGREWQALKHGLVVAVETRNNRIQECETTEILRKMEAVPSLDPMDQVTIDPPAGQAEPTTADPLERIRQKRTAMEPYLSTDVTPCLQHVLDNFDDARRSIYRQEKVQARLSLIEASAWMLHLLDVLEANQDQVEAEPPADTAQQPPNLVPGIDQIRHQVRTIEDRGAGIPPDFILAGINCLIEADRFRFQDHQQHEAQRLLAVCGAWCAFQINEIQANHSTK